ncbi:hypothetical protein A2721_02595 [Candidatus Gottesmanbacteria bacterium RIFCSPHIGHO2_01_FULL_47_48]|uniref:GH26 domain-containing protein n=1 Tax=Candidatus Gottesmanbacteria bacterium RIFCSPHIGHO2_01_FULL_47_48 TaxID=1798381 RepID=A0A1F6A4M3_9BACT|nr:MAG: hypothetical protein A2721_02595 [Candidatus Gottesmanbacteria bacterium RIFCSPHIGHO2_01_FULL_47_48]
MHKYLLVAIITVAGILVLSQLPRLFRSPNLSELRNDQSPIIPSSGIALGIYQPQKDTSGDNIDRYIKEAGRKPAFAWQPTTWKRLDGSYIPFYPPMLDEFRTRGIMPGITWSPSKGSIEAYPDRQQAINQTDYSWKAIASGRHDQYITQFAKDAAAYHYPFILRFLHEMDGTWYPWGYSVNGNTNPADFVAAWKHIVDIFRREKATNVQFVWCASVLSDDNLNTYGGIFKELYPGDNYVDWVALDGYSNAQNNWRSLEDEFKSTYDFVTGFSSRPMILWEVGAMANPDDPMAQANWIKQGFLTTIPEKLPKVKVAVWFNSRDGSGRDYRLQSSPNAVAAWKQVVESPLYQESLLK